MTISQIQKQKVLDNLSKAYKKKTPVTSNAHHSKRSGISDISPVRSSRSPMISSRMKNNDSFDDPGLNFTLNK